MASSDWDPGQYERFKAERSQPFWDLVDLVDTSRPIERAADLGCGTGELTAAAAARLGVGEMIGLDDSPNMLAHAEQRTTSTVRFRAADIGTWSEPDTYDLILANASLQWVPDHPGVLARWAGSLRPGGQLAVQVPANHDHPSHLASAHVATQPPFVEAFDGGPPPDPVAVNVLAPEAYSEVLFALGIAEPHVRLQVYPHLLDSTASIVEWTKGTSLLRFFKRLPIELHDPFVAAYRDELLTRLGRRSPYLYSFKRILMYVARPAMS